jgi:hypothetical protein
MIPLRASGQDLQVKPTAEHPVVAGDYHRTNVVAIGIVERLVEGLLHGWPQRIDLSSSIVITATDSSRR